MEQHLLQRELAQDLVPLVLAAESVYSIVYRYEVASDDEVRRARLDHLAAAIASGGSTLYTYHPQKPSVISQLQETDLLHGRFRDGGKTLAFNDGRPPVRNLAVTRGTISHVLALLALKGELKAAAETGKLNRPSSR